MTNRDALLAVVEHLDEEQIARLLGYADGIAHLPRPSATIAAHGVDDADDPLLALIGVGQSAEPTSVAEHKDDYLAEAFETRGR